MKTQLPAEKLTITTKDTEPTMEQQINSAIQANLRDFRKECQIQKLVFNSELEFIKCVESVKTAMFLDAQAIFDEAHCKRLKKVVESDKTSQKSAKDLLINNAGNF